MHSRLTRTLAAALLISSSGAALAQGSWRKTGDGIVVTPASGPEAVVRLQLFGDRIVRVTAVPTPDLNLPASYMVNAAPSRVPFEASEANGRVTLATASVRASVDLSNGNVTFIDSSGELDLIEAAPAAFAPVQIEGQKFLSTHQQFNRGTDEGLYGLGQHQNGQMNYNGEDVTLFQHNVAIPVPFLVSTRNYGLLWDSNSITRFGNPKPYALAGSAGDGLRVTGADGKPGWTAHYYLGERLAVTQSEPAINYQHIRDQAKWPAAAKAQTTAGTTGQNTAGNVVQTQRVTWSGKATPAATGLHRFRLYSSSYVKLFVDGREVLSRWRQNWNPWYHNFDLPMVAGKPADIRIEWEPNAGYIALEHSDPLPEADRHSIQFSSDAGRAVDYYYVGGSDMDEVIAGYRKLTGKAVMLPKWAYGFWQSRQRYETQEQLVGVVEEYRKRGLPLDNIVQDWFYWPEDQWGCHCFDPKRFPDPKAMVDKVHALDARVMISVWPKFYPTTANYRELEKAGAIYKRNLELGDKDWVGPGYVSTFYDPYSKAGADIYWRQIRDDLAELGFDAWWMDATEPDMHSNLSLEERAYRMGPTADGPGAAVFNSYPLVHAENVFDGWMKYKPGVRPFILTRAGFRGAAAHRLGDLVGRHRVALGRPSRPDFGRGQRVDGRHSQLDPRHRRLRQRGPLYAKRPGAPRRMARAQHPLVPVRRLFTAVSKPRRVAEAGDIRARARRLADLREPRLVRPAALPAHALYLHPCRRHLSP